MRRVRVMLGCNLAVAHSQIVGTVCLPPSITYHFALAFELTWHTDPCSTLDARRYSVLLAAHSMQTGSPKAWRTRVGVETA